MHNKMRRVIERIRHLMRVLTPFSVSRHEPASGRRLQNLALVCAHVPKHMIYGSGKIKKDGVLQRNSPVRSFLLRSVWDRSRFEQAKNGKCSFLTPLHVQGHLEPRSSLVSFYAYSKKVWKVRRIETNAGFQAPGSSSPRSSCDQRRIDPGKGARVCWASRVVQEAHPQHLRSA